MVQSRMSDALHNVGSACIGYAGGGTSACGASLEMCCKFRP